MGMNNMNPNPNYPYGNMSGGGFGGNQGMPNNFGGGGMYNNPL